MCVDVLSCKLCIDFIINLKQKEYEAWIDTSRINNIITMTSNEKELRKVGRWIDRKEVDKNKYQVQVVQDSGKKGF